MTDSDTLTAVERWFRSRGGDLWGRPVAVTSELPQRFAVRAVYLASRSAAGA